MVRSHALVVGAGIGGLAAARALSEHGWRVTVVERDDAPATGGAAISVSPNALRALDVIGEGDAVRARSALGSAAIRRPDGRRLVRPDPSRIRDRYGDPVVVLRRTEVLAALLSGLPATALRTAAEVDDVQAGDPRGGGPARVRLRAGEEIPADLVVAADGVHSELRRRLFPGLPGAARTGDTAWRLIVPAPRAGIESGESWGRGRVAGIVTLPDGELYAYFTDRLPPDTPERDDRDPSDERDRLLRGFGAWHDPIPQVIASASAADILRNDVFRLRAAPPAYHRGRVALLGDAAHAMAPNLGQGACQALEDAVVLADAVTAEGVGAGLASYTRTRRPRARRIALRSRRVGAVAGTRSKLLGSVRDAGLAAMGHASPGLVDRAFDGVFGWQPPARAAAPPH